MVRQWKEVAGAVGVGSSQDLSSAAFIFWAALAVLFLITAIMFSCAGGASKDKASATNADAYGSTCAACGAGCGG